MLARSPLGRGPPRREGVLRGGPRHEEHRQHRHDGPAGATPVEPRPGKSGRPDEQQTGQHRHERRRRARRASRAGRGAHPRPTPGHHRVRPRVCRPARGTIGVAYARGVPCRGPAVPPKEAPRDQQRPEGGPGRRPDRGAGRRGVAGGGRGRTLRGLRPGHRGAARRGRRRAAGGRAGRARRRGRRPAGLGRHATPGARGDPAPGLRSADRPRRRARAAHHAGDGQERRRVQGRGGLRRGVLPVVLRGGGPGRGPVLPRTCHTRAAAHHEAAGGPVPADHALELPAGHGDPQDRAGCRGGLHDGRQAGAAHAADDDARGRAAGGGRPSCRRAQRGALDLGGHGRSAR